MRYTIDVVEGSHMDVSGTSVAAIREKLREFDRAAAALKMPRKERLAILNTSESTYVALQKGTATSDLVEPELERRLSYAMPLMRRLASNSVDLSATPTGPEFRSAAA